MAMVGQGGRFSRIHEVSTDGKRTWSPATNHPNLFPQSTGGKKRRQPEPPPQPAAAASLAEPDIVLAPADATRPASEAPIELVDFDGGPGWYYHRNNANTGPVSLSAVQQLVRAGDLGPDTLVWEEDTPNWIKVKDHHSLAGHLPSNPLSFPESAPASTTAAGAAKQETALTAIASLVSAIGGMTLFPFLGSILAIVFGHMALSQLKLNSRLRGRNLALAGLVMGYVELAIILFAGLILIIILLMKRS